METESARVSARAPSRQRDRHSEEVWQPPTKTVCAAVGARAPRWRWMTAAQAPSCVVFAHATERTSSSRRGSQHLGAPCRRTSQRKRTANGPQSAQTDRNQTDRIHCPCRRTQSRVFSLRSNAVHRIVISMHKFVNIYDKKDGFGHFERIRSFYIL